MRMAELLWRWNAARFVSTDFKLGGNGIRHYFRIFRLQNYRMYVISVWKYTWSVHWQQSLDPLQWFSCWNNLEAKSKNYFPVIIFLILSWTSVILVRFDILIDPEDGSSRFLRTWVSIYQTTWRHVPKDRNFSLIFENFRFSHHWLWWVQLSGIWSSVVW
jgi:hypothetical protein